uniref:inositol-tetrakisphosphate 1-kinase isoform X2 n=1 Tax=Myxine glutinosa TaxID=7769 RepID=UPI00358F7282
MGKMQGPSGGVGPQRVGYWMSEKKEKRINFAAFGDLCRAHGIELVKVDLEKPMEEQGPFQVIVHKLTDPLLEASQGNQSARAIVQRFEDFISRHPETTLLDPLQSIRLLLNRCHSYQMIQELDLCQTDGIINTPPFVELRTTKREEIIRRLNNNCITFPFVCKNVVAHGSNSHEMAIIFNEDGLVDVKPPCVAQSFINHNAILYKVFVVGSMFSIVERPSLKNFPLGKSDRKTIFFNSHDVSKAESTSHLNEEPSRAVRLHQPSRQVLKSVVERLQEKVSMALFGFDVIMECGTDRYKVIDINAFPAIGSGSRRIELSLVLAWVEDGCASCRVRLRDLSELCGTLNDRRRKVSPGSGALWTRCGRAVWSSQEFGVGGRFAAASQLSVPCGDSRHLVCSSAETRGPFTLVLIGERLSIGRLTKPSLFSFTFPCVCNCV